MTREEVVDTLKRRMIARDVTQAVIHPAFEAFVAELQDRQGLDVVDAWYFFREGWETEGGRL